MLIEKNSGKLLYPEWRNVSGCIDTEESFVVVPLHNERLQTALNDRVAALKEDPRWAPTLTPDQKFLCEGMGTPLPFTPVADEPEYRNFSKLMLADDSRRFDSDEMAISWMETVDGKTIFPKLPCHLREYHRRWERNARIKRAMEELKKDKDLLSISTR